jgi:valyl-tRNA synthetase
LLVDINFGTGALKITPGHDATDFEIGKSHKLPTISVIDELGRMTNTPQKYIGMKVEKAREEVVADLEKAGLVKKIETIHHNVGVCYRDKGLLEPTISKQWFVKVEPLAKRVLAVIKKDQVKFTSSSYEKIAKNWLKNLYDWNISRQIVWGIRIPAWRCQKCLEWTVTDGDLPEKCSSCGHSELTQDSDTFDTWFSSGQWPFATLQTTRPGDFEYFYPTTVMDPSYDILPFWVIRMLMLGLYVTDNVPFEIVLLHGLVRDKYGVKISKSKGNVIDPIEMVNKYGADALRMASIWGSLVENDNSLSEDNIRGQRNFANKIWNIARFVMLEPKGKRTKKNSDDIQILKDLKLTTKKVTKLLDKYRLNEAANELYDFVWHKFADNYLEKVKGRREKAQKNLEYVLQQSLKLLHPFMPFVTETIWQEGKDRFDSAYLISSIWPK